jgi:hypothetical protein
MSSYCRSFETAAEALRAAASLRAAGVPDADVRVLTAAAPLDTAGSPVGTFASEDARKGVVGTFASEDARESVVGTFAGGGASGVRMGSFADTDREELHRFVGGAERVDSLSHQEVEDLLVEAGINRDGAKADVQALHHGHVLLLIGTANVDFERIRVALGG